MSSQTAIREGGLADRAFALDLGKRTMGDSVASFRYHTQALLDASYEGLLEYVFAQSHVLLVAERDGAAAGFILLLDTLPDEVTRMPQAFVVYMAVEPWARRSGMGKQLLAAAEAAARERRLPYMGLMVTEENEAARRLYESAGYLSERRLLCKPL
ncbi:MAG: N-acetyltransferase family protein [Candidatus Baltobacteraceae bacterium]